MSDFLIRRILRTNRHERAEASARHGASGRHGLTLVELLVVIGILSLLAALTLPNVRDVIREQKFTRTAGIIQSYVAGAQAKAIGEGRRYGVVIERASADSAIGRAHSVRLSYAYGPPLYTGDVAGARAVVTNLGNLAFDPADAPTLLAARDQVAQNMPNPVIGPGDTIGIGLVPFYFEVTGLIPLTGQNLGSFGMPANPGQWTVAVFTGPVRAQILAQYTAGTQLPFRIVRKPTPSMTAPLELPEGTAIDLVYSGIGLFGDDFSPLAIENRRRDATNTPITNRYGVLPYNPGATLPFADGFVDYESITIMFDSQGTVNEIRFGNPSTAGVTDQVVVSGGFPASNIYLLLGKSDGVYPDAPFFVTNKDRANIADFESAWVVINRQTGQVAVSPISSFAVDAAGNILNPQTGLVVAAATDTLQNRVQAAIALTRSEAAAYSAVGL